MAIWPMDGCEARGMGLYAALALKSPAEGTGPALGWPAAILPLPGLVKRTRSVSLNGPIRRGFCEVYVERKLEQDFVPPLFERIHNFEKFHSESCEHRKQSPSSLHDDNICYLYFATWRYLFTLILTSPNWAIRFQKVKCQMSLIKSDEPAKKFPQKVSEHNDDSPRKM
jgi:hypothetical protein